MLDTQIAENGEFRFDPDFLLPGNYSVFVVNGQYSIISSLAASGAKVVGQNIQITGSTPIQSNIELSRTLSKISGTALRHGKPFAGAMIVLVPEHPETNMPLFRRDQSDSDGLSRYLMCCPGHIGSWQSTAGMWSGSILRFSKPGSIMPKKPMTGPM
jgi:hypothetical protein